MQIQLLRHKIIDYPSGSALEYHNHTLYLIGDDVHYILCLDEHWDVQRQLRLFEYNGERIPKPEKPDLECATIIGETLYVMGSGSLSPQRDVAFIVQLSNNRVKRINTGLFYGIFRNMGLIQEMNIEGFTDCKDRLLFFNRGNTTQPNQLIVTDHKILQKQFPDKFKVMPVAIGTLGNVALGISGACYDARRDILLLTASAEDTSNSYDDGTIVGSVIGVVHNAYAQLNKQTFAIDALLPLETIDPAFAQQKIESICITAAADTYRCTLVADNDDGKSVLFEIEITV